MRARAISVPVWFAATALVVALGACGPRVGDISPTLIPGDEGPFWPAPPQKVRYAFAGSLIGEQDFIDPSKRERSGARQAAEWLIGLVIGQQRYKELMRPVSGLVRPDGAVLVVDAGLKGVAVFDMAAKQFRIWDEAAPGEGFASPIGLAPDGAGGWLVTDSELGRVFRLTAEGQPAGLFTPNRLRRPTGIARDPASGTIYVADSATHEVLVFDSAGNPKGRLGGPGKADGQFNAPTHLAWSGGRLLVSDTLNFRVQIFTPDGALERSFGQVGLRVGDLFRPKGVAAGRDGRVYVVESYYDHLLVFDQEGELLLPIGGTGNEVGSFYLPSGVWTDGAGRVFVADMFNGRVIVLSETDGAEGRG